MRVFGDNGGITYTCSQVKELRNDWIEEFKKKNRSDELYYPDPKLKEYIQELDGFIAKCTDISQSK
jgi:hypothetical protein